MGLEAVDCKWPTTCSFPPCSQHVYNRPCQTQKIAIELNFVEGCNSGPEESGSRLHAIDGARHHVSIDTLYQGYECPRPHPSPMPQKLVLILTYVCTLWVVLTPRGTSCSVPCYNDPVRFDDTLIHD